MELLSGRTRGWRRCFSLFLLLSLARSSWAQDLSVDRAVQLLDSVQAATDSLVESIRSADEELRGAEKAAVEASNQTRIAGARATKLSAEVQNRTDWIDEYMQMVPKINTTMNSNEEALKAMVTQDAQVASLLSKVKAQYGDSITADEERYLETLIKETWDVSDPDEESSIQRMTARIDKANIVLTDLKGVLRHRIQHVLMHRLRGKTNMLRRSLGKLQAKAGGESLQPDSEATDDQGGEEGLGSILGLT
mmetsp:Transcript_68461/g.164392  ORF Transcript_68461/g.164392 Transcript_68461/m.164392 type:complete len:250 (-) Transcript_68461:127-876(-)